MPIFSHKFSGLLKPKPRPEPLVIKDALGTFTLEKGDSYSGEAKLLGREITVFLETDGDGQTTADNSLKNLHVFAANAAKWDADIKQFAADDFADVNGMIETWGSCEDDSEGEVISKEEFTRRISMNFIQFYRDGSIFLDYDLDELFTDHGLGVHAHISGRIESCALWG